MANKPVHWDDEWDNDPAASSTPSSVVAAPARAAKPRMTQDERDASRLEKKKNDRNETRRAVSRRQRWEQSAAGQERSADITQLTGGTHNPAQAYHELGIHHSGAGYGQDQLPGIGENPHKVPTPPRWEDLAPEQQAHAQRELKRRGGTDISTMSKQFGAQMDQGYHRALRAGHTDDSGAPVPFTKHFYDDDTPEGAPEPLDRPKALMSETARKHGVDLGVVTAATALTSPNVKFTSGERGSRDSPNVEAASVAIEQHQAGIPAHAMGHLQNPETGKSRTTARPANIRRAGRMLETVEQGGRIADARNGATFTNPEGSSMWRAPKVGPFNNSFQSDTPDYFVSDVHSGGGGMLPHLDVEKPFKLDTQGKRIRNKEYREDPRPDHELEAAHGAHKVYVKDKSEREKVIEKTPNFHAMADFAARQAMSARGMGGSVRQGQAVQWGEEQIKRKSETPKLDVPSHEDAYPAHLSKQFTPVHPEQGKLF